MTFFASGFNEMQWSFVPNSFLFELLFNHDLIFNTASITLDIVSITVSTFSAQHLSLLSNHPLLSTYFQYNILYSCHSVFHFFNYLSFLPQCHSIPYPQHSVTTSTFVLVFAIFTAMS